MKRKQVVAKAKKAPTPSPSAPRVRQTNVRQMILDHISKKPSAYSVLIREGGYSKSAFQRHISSLLQDGTVIRVDGLYTVKKAPITGEIVDLPVAREKPATALVKRAVSLELSEALADLATRLSPIERVEEKLHVLDHVASLMTPTIRIVIHEVMADIVKLSKAG